MHSSIVAVVGARFPKDVVRMQTINCSLEDLRNLHILPRTPSPEPLERQDPSKLSAADIAELQQRVIAMQADNGEIKREMAETSERPRKKARVTAPSEVIDLTIEET